MASFNSQSNPTKTTVNNCEKPRLIAFYLPQFHPIPENDQWWGPGFTEWINVSKAKPLFPGHQQPHIPGDLGFYDLRLAETRKSQAQFAKKYGISGFCYYHYWFNGKRLLNYPLDEMIKSGQPDFPFCLCWANENWTRTWDGQKNDILINQNYTEVDDLEHIRFLCNIFKDKRYIRVEGKPLMLIYRAGSLPDPQNTTRIWRDEARRLGIGELYLCRVESFEEEHSHPQGIGFDAAVEFQPDWGNLGKLIPQFQPLHVYDYVDFVNKQVTKSPVSYIRHPCVTPRWDNSPRKGTEGIIFANSSPAAYQYWLKHAICQAESYPSEQRIVFINAWNEWGEGNYLEPDRHSGHAYLEATLNALENPSKTTPISNISQEKNLPVSDPLEKLADLQSQLYTYQNLSKHIQSKLDNIISENESLRMEIEQLRVKADHLEAQVTIQSRTLAPLGYILTFISYLVIIIRSIPIIIRGYLSKRHSNPFKEY